MPFNKIPRETKQRFSHGLAGVVILIKAFDKHDHGDALAAGIIAMGGVFFVLFALLHPWLHKFPSHRHLETTAFLAEALVLATIGGNYFHHGKHALPWMYVGVTIVYLILAIRQHRHNLAHHD